jgi:hypothetical protein
MPFLIYPALAAGAAAGWWYWGDDPTPAEDTNKTIRTIAILALAIVIIRFIKGK